MKTKPFAFINTNYSDPQDMEVNESTRHSKGRRQAVFPIYKNNCCGLDVHKTWIYACIGITDEKGDTEYYRKRFSSFKSGLNELAEYLLSYNCHDVCMESSGKYWIPVFNVLEEHVNVVVAHPKYTKPRKGKKSDVQDAKWICDLYKCGMIEPSFIPPKDIRDLRDLTRFRKKFLNERSSDKNRALNCLTACNYKLDDVFSDVFGKSSRSIVDALLAHPGEEIEDVSKYLRKGCKCSPEEVQEALKGKLTDAEALKLRTCLNHMDQIDEHIEILEKKMIALAEPHKDSLNLIKTIPGLGKDMTAITVLAELGDDMSVFPSSKHLVSWAGCCPRHDSSANKVKYTRISSAGYYLKPVLVQVANGLVRSKEHPEFGDRYRRIKARRGHGKAIIAVCHMLLTSIWNVLAKRVPYDPSGYMKGKKDQKQRNDGPVKITPDQAKIVLHELGFVVEEATADANSA